jgi:hypothetical protein
MIDTTSPTLLHRHAAVHLLKIELMQFEGPIGSQRADFDFAKLWRKYRPYLERTANRIELLAQTVLIVCMVVSSMYFTGEPAEDQARHSAAGAVFALLFCTLLMYLVAIVWAQCCMVSQQESEGEEQVDGLTEQHRGHKTFGGGQAEEIESINAVDEEGGIEMADQPEGIDEGIELQELDRESDLKQGESVIFDLDDMNEMGTLDAIQASTADQAMSVADLPDFEAPALKEDAGVEEGVGVKKSQSVQSAAESKPQLAQSAEQIGLLAAQNEASMLEIKQVKAKLLEMAALKDEYKERNTQLEQKQEPLETHLVTMKAEHESSMRLVAERNIQLEQELDELENAD